jgi:hypothetical protein
MPVSENIEIKGFNLSDIVPILVSALIFMLEEAIKHPIGTAASIFCLLYTFDRWKTQRFDRKIKEQEYERSIRNSSEHKKGAKN